MSTLSVNSHNCESCASATLWCKTSFSLSEINVRQAHIEQSRTSRKAFCILGFSLVLAIACFRRAGEGRFRPHMYEAVVCVRAQPIEKIYSIVTSESPRTESSSIIYASYFAGYCILGFSEKIPTPEEETAALADIRTLNPDSVLLTGDTQDDNHRVFTEYRSAAE